MDEFLPPAVVSFLDQSLEQIYSLEKYVEPTVILVPGFVEGLVKDLSDGIGFDVETLNYVLGLFLCYPLGLIMTCLPYGQTRHLFSFLLGAFLMQFTLGVQWIHQFITSVVAYAMFLVLPRKFAKWAVPAFVMTYCVLGHLHRQYINYLGWDLDFTGAQMVITQKLWIMAFNLADGEALAKGTPDKAAKKCSKFALDKLPNFLEFLGYTFCFSSVLSGPSMEFSIYRGACDGSIFNKPDGTPSGKIPSNISATFRPLLTSILNLGLFVVLGGYFPLLDPADPQGGTPVVLTQEFLARPWILRYAYTWMGLVGVRQKYYFAWKNAEGASNIWYVGFSGFDEKGNSLGFDNANNMNIWTFETAENVSTLSKEWNKKTSLWLSRYVYMRTNGSLAAVYSTSAFWHGFYPGYYLFFLSVPLLTFCERLAKKKISPYFPPEKWSIPYGVLSVAATSFCAEYMVIPFVLLAKDRSWDAWKSHYFCAHIGCIVYYVVLTQLPTPKKDTSKNA